MNNFLNNLLANPAMLQKALMAGLLGNFSGGSGQDNSALGALLNPQNGAYLGQSNFVDGASQAYQKMPEPSQNRDHRCNLNLEEHQKYADALVSIGIIDKDTGKSIKDKMTAVFRAESGSSANGGAKRPFKNRDAAVDLVQNGAGTADYTNFEQSEFLKARECLLEYLQNLDVELTLEDLAAIEDVVLQLEKIAVMRHMKASGKEITDENPYESAFKANELAKDRILTGSLGSKSGKSPLGKNFTREEIAKMSTAEFIKNEPQINYQLQNGLI